MKRRAVAIAALAAIALAALPAEALAGTPNMRISGPGTVAFGASAPVTITLFNGSTPLSGETIHINVNGHHVTDLRTSSGGVAVYRLSRSSVPATYRVLAVFDGDASRGVSGASVTAVVTVRAPSATALALSVPPPTKTGQKLSIDVTLGSPTRGSLAGQAVHIVVGNLRDLDVIIHDPGGAAHVALSRNTPAGDYQVTASYHGNKPLGLAPASDTQTLTVLPLSVDVQTLPMLSGAPITLDNQIVSTDSQGLAHFTLQAAGNHQIGAGVPADTPDAKAVFARWSDGQIDAQRPLHVLQDMVVLAGYRTSIHTELRFLDADGKAIDTARVGSVSIAGPDGTTTTLHAPYEPQWLSYPAPSRQALTLGHATARFSLVSATYDGVVVANRGDDPLLPEPGQPWNLKLRIYSLHITTHHPVLPGAGPRAVRVSPKHGTPLIVALDDNGEATISDLPRDDYTVLVPASAYAPQVPVTLSRDQSVNMVVVGAQDILVAGVVVLLVIAFLVILARRPQWLPRFGA